MLESLLQKVAENGLAGVFLALALLAGVALFNQLKQSWIDRIAEQKALHPVLDATAKSNLSIGVAMENRNAAIETLGKAQEATARELAIVARDLDRHIAAQEKRDETDRQRWERIERALGTIEGRRT